MEWCDKKIELLLNFYSQNTFLFGVKLSDYHNRILRAASWSSAITNFDAINWRHNLVSNLWHRFLAPVSGACVGGFMFPWISVISLYKYA